METQPDPKVVSQVNARLRERLPGTAEQEIEREVTAVFEDYADSKVRDFLPILVEREVVARVRSRAHRVPHARA